MGTPWYATREMLASASDIKPSASAARMLDRILASATESVNSLLVRPLGLYPTVTTFVFDWPADPRSRGYRLWLDERTIIELTSASSGGVTLDVDDLLLYPQSGPPYTAIETNRGTNTIFGGGATPQGDITLGVLGGHRNDEMTAGELVTTVDATLGEIVVDGDTAAAVGVGDLLRLDDERVLVRNRTWSATGSVLAAGVGAQNSLRELTIADSSGFAAGESLLIGIERMNVLDVVPGSLIVERAAQGGVLDDHLTGATIFGSRTLIVERGALGTTAAGHTAGADVVAWMPPPLARELCIAEALNTGAQLLSAYARTSGSGENAREYVGRALKDIRTDARRQLGRRSRLTAV